MKELELNLNYNLFNIHVDTGEETPTQEYSWHHGEQLHTGSNSTNTAVMTTVGM